MRLLSGGSFCWDVERIIRFFMSLLFSVGSALELDRCRTAQSPIKRRGVCDARHGKTLRATEDVT